MLAFQNVIQLSNYYQYFIQLFPPKPIILEKSIILPSEFTTSHSCLSRRALKMLHWQSPCATLDHKSIPMECREQTELVCPPIWECLLTAHCYLRVVAKDTNHHRPGWNEYTTDELLYLYRFWLIASGTDQNWYRSGHLAAKSVCASLQSQSHITTSNGRHIPAPYDYDVQTDNHPNWMSVCKGYCTWSSYII